MKLGLSLSLSAPRGSSGYTVVNAEATALIARMSTAPNDTRKAQIDTLVGALKTAGVWAKLDALYVLAAADSQASLLNWLGSTFDATAVSTTFTADRGHTGNGTSAYISTGFNPTTATTPKFVQNSGHMSFWSRTSGQSSNVDMGNFNSLIVCRNGSNQTSHRINAAASGVPSNLDGSGFFATSRTGTANVDNFLYRNGVALGGSNTSEAPNNSEIRVLGRGGASLSYSARECAAASIGGGLTAGEVTDFYNALNTYLVAVGAA